MNYQERQYLFHHAEVLYWHVMATTGKATERQLSRGREPTEEEKSKGMVIGWEPLTDKEKIDEALKTMQRHLDMMRELGDKMSEGEP
jgi:hypothetical protein